MRPSRVFVALALCLSFAVPAAAGDSVFEFGKLRGIPTPGLNIRDIPGGGLPWTITRGEAQLDQDGVLRVEVEGLVLAAGPSAGTNPVPQFVATLSCLNADGSVNNVSTTPVPATSTGDAEIQEALTLPDTCLGPIVFVRGVLAPTPRWFAISGF